MKIISAGLRFLMTLAFASLGFILPTQAAFAEPSPPAGIQSPGFYRMTVGNFELVALFDGHTELPQQLLKGIQATNIQTLLHRAFYPAGQPMQTAVNAYLVHTGEHLVLVDTGAAACFGASLGNIRKNLQAAGYKPEDVDTVLLTHLHPDHACGLADENGAAAFPAATVWTSTNEADYWLNKELAARAPEGKAAMFSLARQSVAPYLASDKFQTYAPGDALLPGVSIAPSPGHTPGHSGYLFESQGASLLIWGDIVHNHAVQLTHPEVSIEFDSDQTAAIATRKKILADAAQKRLLIAGAHLPFPGIGHVVVEKKGYRWVPVDFGQNFPGKE